MTADIINSLDFDRINSLLEGFNKSTGFVTAILDLEGNVLSKSGWRSICTNFHRVDAQTAAKCTMSDTELANKMAEGANYHFYKCMNGLIDVAVPLVIHGEHIANLFSGQFFFEKPDLELFRRQAEKYGFNNEEYLKALSEVPVFSEQRVKPAMDFLLDMTALIAEMTMQRMQQNQLHRDLQEKQNQLNFKNEELRHAKEKAELNENYLKNIINNMGDPVFVKDDQSRILLANDAFCSLFELSREQIMGKTLAEDVTPEEKESFLKIDRQILADGIENTSIETLTIRGGHTRTISTRKTLFTDSSGKKFLVCAIRDISERILAEQNLVESEKNYRELFENMNAGFVLFEVVLNDDHLPVDLKIIAANERFGATTGLKLKNAIGKLLTNALPGIESDAANWIGTYSKVALTGVPQQFEQGSELLGVYYSVNAYQSGTGRCAVTFVDITERKLAEAEVINLNEELEQRITERTKELSDLYNNAPCGYHSLDTNGVFLHMNDTELKLLGYQREEVINLLKITDIMSSESQEKFRATYPLFKENGTLKDVEFDYIKSDGTIFPILLSATAVYDEDDNYAMSRSTLIDNTNLKKAKNEILKAKAALEITNKELEAFSYSVSHDLRAPLRGINGFAQILVEDYASQLDDEAKRICSIIQGNSRKMGRLIDELLAFSRLSRAEIQHSQIEMKKMVVSVCQEIIDEKASERINLNIGDMFNIAGDPAMMKQVWTNLLLNAVKYSSKRKKAVITVSCTKENDAYVYCVKDNGAGFEMEYVSKLFGVFQRLHNAKDFEGTGVGLAIVQRIIHRHGGTVWAEGKVNKGASFYFSLPVPANG